MFFLIYGGGGGGGGEWERISYHAFFFSSVKNFCCTRIGSLNIFKMIIFFLWYGIQVITNSGIDFKN